jgi:hypothetical protein
MSDPQDPVLVTVVDANGQNSKKFKAVTAKQLLKVVLLARGKGTLEDEAGVTLTDGYGNLAPKTYKFKLSYGKFFALTDISWLLLLAPASPALEYFLTLLAMRQRTPTTVSSCAGGIPEGERLP